MPRTIYKSIEDRLAASSIAIEFVPLRLVNGAIHMHWIVMFKRGFWIARSMHSEICGTDRCIVLPIRRGILEITCEHNWQLPPPGTVVMLCDRCGEHKELVVKV